jgi:phosphoglycerol transferase MdoB-like AlkP superfamily enzyme
LESLLKCIFFFYNYSIFNGWSITELADGWLILKWSLLYDSLLIALVNLPLTLILFVAGKFLQYRLANLFVLSLFTLINTFIIFLNTIDIFYFRFHLQRADADLMYVLRNPFENSHFKVLIIILSALFFSGCIAWYIYKNIKKITQAARQGNHFALTNIFLILFISLFFLTGNKKVLPTYPLTELKAVQLPLVQNSFHSFIYSLYRRKEALIPMSHYMTAARQESLFKIHKINNPVSAPKNIILFIMESVPREFFDSSSPYKVAMPFLDSLVNKSTSYSNAFSYSYNSNKGITAILAGIPTLTDIPLYHSNYTSIKRTSAGTVLAKNNYSSAFFIGDNYDDFGFAKCCNWLGIEQYYCMQDIPSYRQMEKHSMGLHDEYVLNFMQDKLEKMRQPFFAVQYNISTHYPNDIPKTFKDKYPAVNTTPPMKTMQYYNDCLQQFFSDAYNKPWFRNTVFIFCSDHWAQPHTNNIKIDMVESFRIPLFIYDPGKEKKMIVSSPVSQLDILNTILYYGGFKDSITSYGVNLFDIMLQDNRTVFCKVNSVVYQAINAEYLLGFDASEGKALYCYDYKKDPEKKINLLQQPITAEVNQILLQMKAFLQTASQHYRGNKN